MKFSKDHPDDVKIGLLQRWIIVQSILYYEFSRTLATDKIFDDNARQLVQLMKDKSEEQLRRTEYGYCMWDFDGTTGFDLYDRLNEQDKKYLTHIAQTLIK